MRSVKGHFGLREKRALALALGLAWVFLFGVSSVEAQAMSSSQDPVPNSRLLTVREGRSIVKTARGLERPASRIHDCSHLIHEIYQHAGFDYPYQSSFELYAGAEKFARVRYPHTGDLIVWPGHVGIVVDPLQHSFYSLVRTGLEEQDYKGPYWKSRGTPHFYRYKIENKDFSTSAKTPSSVQVSNAKGSQHLERAIGDPSTESNSGLNLPAKTTSVHGPVIYGPQTPSRLSNAVQDFEVPSSIVITESRRLPTREEIGEGISELTDAEGNILRTDDPMNVPMPVVIVERFSVERLEIKHDHGWAHLQIYSKASIAGGTIQLKRLNEKAIWELRRTESGWEAVRPRDRVYVPQDVAVKYLAAQLARLAESNSASTRREEILRQESQLAQLLNALLAGE